MSVVCARVTNTSSTAFANWDPLRGGTGTEVKHLEHHQTTQPPVAPAAAGSVLPPTRQAGPSVGAQTCPPLAELLETVTEIDRLQARAIQQIARLQVSGEDVAQTGIAADTWLAVQGRMTRTDRRMLATVAEHLSRLPLTAREVTNGGLSWSQLRTIITMLVRQHRIRAHEWHAVDAAIATAVGQAHADDPDDVIRIVDDWLYARHPDTIEDAEADASDRRFLAIQPRLDGTGGRFWGDTDAVGLALLDTTTAPHMDQLPDDEQLTPVGRSAVPATTTSWHTWPPPPVTAPPQTSPTCSPWTTTPSSACHKPTPSCSPA